ncbi:HTH_48 domain-containing protein [Trichonephila clavipes]|uniref:HTH_48 domain-containing protein n=1 Tax=Trichonephila clavipes TaxID=2585209 RepID=A0A8X6VUL1_TRICX|nr:HTH_48 domain-containing protein [Trichonephila clavipes]
MSPIEHEWDTVGRRIARDLRPVASTDELWLRIQTIWNILPQTDIKNLFNSMPRRVAALIAARARKNGHRNLRDDENSIWRCGDESCSGFEWFQRFKEGRQSVNSDPRSGRPSTSSNEDKIAQVKAVVHSDHRLTIREIARECHISVGSCDEILRKVLNMRRVSAKFVPRLLTEDQQFHRLAI